MADEIRQFSAHTINVISNHHTAQSMQKTGVKNIKIQGIFSIASVSQFHMPTAYSLFGFAKKNIHFELKEEYYNIDLHIGAYALPEFVRERMPQ